jgi:CRISPR-associated protein Cmr6
MESYLIDSVKKIVNSYNGKDINPSLYLDKFIGPVDEKDAKVELKKVTELNSIYNPNSRYNILKNLLGFEQKKFKTNGPFTLHLSRNSVLENAGISLHPVYGCVYIPGSGIKGLARHYAEQVWLKSNETEENKKLIIDIFGNENTEKKHENLRAGKIVFHDAFPEKAENILEVSINNCHHQDYYKGKVHDYLPGETGDFEDPNPTYYLTVKSGTVFIFSISLRQDIKVDDNKNLIASTWELLANALNYMGLGAKTSSGFGVFSEVKENGSNINIKNSNDKEIKNKFLKVETSIKFVTPAFLAKTIDCKYKNTQSQKKKYNIQILHVFEQEKSDYELTSNTIRGQLRWWWRVIHSNFLQPSELLKLESIIWGSIAENDGGPSPVKIEVKLKTPDKDTKLWEQNSSELKYLSYGIGTEIKIKKNDEIQNILNKQNKTFNSENDKFVIKRYFGMPSYDISILCQDSIYKDKEQIKTIKKETIMEQVKFAFYMLSKYGGLGAKSRKGFGSFKINDNIFLNGINEGIIKNKSKELRKEVFGKENTINNNDWNIIILEKEINPDPDKPLEKLQNIYKSFADKYKHKEQKISLGLPRKIHGPLNKPLPNQINHNPPLKLLHRKGYEKAASPVHFHLEPSKDDKWILRMAIIPSHYLPDYNRCKDFLMDFKKHIEEEIKK